MARYRPKSVLSEIIGAAGIHTAAALIARLSEEQLDRLRHGDFAQLLIDFVQSPDTVGYQDLREAV